MAPGWSAPRAPSPQKQLGTLAPVEGLADLCVLPALPSQAQAFAQSFGVPQTGPTEASLVRFIVRGPRHPGFGDGDSTHKKSKTPS